MSQQLMFEAYQSCPYTGLRSFTEEESIYFKGRDEDIDLATAQLQRNKFLMLTGASGDGKSSLIYAGIIPNARAGFLKSQYSRWCVADFRPERTPFLNLCRAVANQLDIPAVETVQAELSHGFSALADLYKNSVRYADSQSVVWQEADNTKRAMIKREAANLLILVDQFEEFFTNPENYRQGAPSKEANLVLNLLLETARIALDEDLPIYIVFTMRSDYIGQCAAFRSLPEYLGFSQYFVPRLNRSQLQQVIEEPAILNANSITRRLTERLIHDVTEGVDQLPILQHALNQIWIAAKNGREEMDLIHYAMVGGLNPAELPDGDISLFESWFAFQSAVIRSCYHAPSLQNVLDTHCNKLYEQSGEYYKQKTGKTIADADAKAMIRIVFTCLTKIDQSRAVRNRMTLQEITDIAANPEYTMAAIAGVIDIFRESGNTFIHPFISQEHPEHNQLQPGQILDITHESLIRNWQWLGQWAKEEFDSYSVSKDFQQQLSRWVNSNKSKDFLLSIGQLTYFESWFNKAKPNANWLSRYLDDNTTAAGKQAIAEKTLSDSTEFLNLGARKYYLTRKLMRIGAKRIAAVLAGIVLISLSSFVISGMYKKQNDYVLESIHQESMRLASNITVSTGSRASLIAEELKLGITTIDEAVFSVNDAIPRIHLANSLGQLLALQGQKEPATDIFRSLYLADSLLEKFPIPENDGTGLGILLKEVSDLHAGLEFAWYYNAIPAIDSLRKKNGKRSAELVKYILQKQPQSFEDTRQLNYNLENAINQQSFTPVEIQALLKMLSPFENGQQSEWLRLRYSRDNIMYRGTTEYGFMFNGLFQELAYLYAATGNNEQVSRCIDSLLAYGQNNYQADYASGADNAGNIAVVYYTYDHKDKLDGFSELYCAKKKISQEEFYSRLLGRTIVSNETTSVLDLYFFGNAVTNLNLRFLQRAPLAFFFNKYRQVILSEVKDTDQQNLLMALAWKNEGIMKSLNSEKPVAGDADVKTCFDQAVLHFRKVSEAYLVKPADVMGTTIVDDKSIHRKGLFIYPDYRLPFHPLEPRNFFYFYMTAAFLEYILDNNLMGELFTSAEDMNMVAYWLDGYNAKMFAPSGLMGRLISYTTLKKLDQEISKLPFAKGADLNFLYMYAGTAAGKENDTAGMRQMYLKLVPANLLNILRAKEFGGNVSNQAFRMICTAVKGLYETGEDRKAEEMIAVFKNPINRSSIYAYSAYLLQLQKKSGPLVDRMIDSAKIEVSRAEITTQDQPNREILAPVLALQPTSENISNAFRLIKNIPGRFYATSYVCGAFAFDDKLYEAKSHLPELISDADVADFYKFILYNYDLNKKISGDHWKNYNNNYANLTNLDLRYIDESN